MAWFSLIVLFLGVVYHMGLGVVIACDPAKTRLISNPDFLLHCGFALCFFIVLCYVLTLLG